MKIVISEKQYLRLKEAELEEAVGVPEYIISTAQKLYEKLLKRLKKYQGTIEELENDKLEIEGKFPISDITVKKIIVDFSIVKLPPPQEREIAGAQHHSVSKLLDKFVFKSVNKKTEIKMGFIVAVTEQDSVSDIYDLFEERREQMIPTIAHELKHAFFEKKSKYENLYKRADYSVRTDMNIGFLEPLNDFFYDSYYIHAIENVVRPTELATQMELKGITREKFLEFFNNSEIVQKLKKIREFTYEGMREELLRYTGVIKPFLEKIGADTEGKDDEELVDEVLRIALVNFINRRGDKMKDILTTNFVEQMFGFRGDKEKFFDRYINYIMKFGQDFESFFKSEEKKLRNTADSVLKKLAKLYSLAKHNQ